MDDFTRGYIECALWSSTDLNGDNLEGCEISDELQAQMEADCAEFQDAHDHDLADSGLEPGRAGHDFWLTRNGHGAGFWDEGLGELGERLSRAAKAYGSVNLYLGDDDKVYGS